MSLIDGLDLDTDDFEDEELFDLGLDVIEGRFPEAAVQIGEALIEREYSGGFEIAARGLAALWDFEQAVEVLKEGVEVAPQVWRLRDFLGCYQGELGAMEDARASFQQALELPSADTSVICLHWATVETNAGNFAEARTLAERVTDAEDLDDRQLLSLRIHWSEGNLEEAYKIGRDLLRRDEGENPGWRAMAAATLGEVCLRLDKEDEALALAREAAGLDDANEAVLHLVRELGGRMAEGTPTMYYVLFQGAEELDGEMTPYLQRLEVTAESEEDAKALALAYLEIAGKADLKLDSVSAEYQRGATMAGVYEVSAKHYYEDEEEGEE